jgi:hypothetical protein
VCFLEYCLGFISTSWGRDGGEEKCTFEYATLTRSVFTRYLQPADTAFYKFEYNTIRQLLHLYIWNRGRSEFAEVEFASRSTVCFAFPVSISTGC